MIELQKRFIGRTNGKNTRYTTIFSVEMAASVENYLQALPKL
ncbi:hypothetical protein HMPREF9999_00113 [Alloprevotella sp. oral taxon 473 str. F0040]|nr:hypothetical protein HMPREF9999_00113 [Alloprevotella sp. oral taxon 473 str. F0040]